jgi:hypothetical protein
MRFFLGASIGDTGLKEALDRISRRDWFQDPPEDIEVDQRSFKDSAHWTSALLAAKKHGVASWQSDPYEYPKGVAVNRVASPPRLQFGVPHAFDDLEEGIRLIEGFPFEVCSISPTSETQVNAWGKLGIANISFGAGHERHGWACAFRGRGHDQLVSRRWLNFGPWRVIRRPNDLTVVQFHDLDADPKTAGEQAQPGWERMGWSATCGYVGTDFPFSSRGVSGLYAPSARKLEIVIPPGGRVEQWHMLEACAVRTRHHITERRIFSVADDASTPHGGVRASAISTSVEPFTPSQPIDQVAFVFTEEADARAHLHELWLRDLECWVVDGDGRRRMDEDYEPPSPVKSEWVRRLDDEETFRARGR